MTTSYVVYMEWLKNSKLLKQTNKTSQLNCGMFLKYFLFMFSLEDAHQEERTLERELWRYVLGKSYDKFLWKSWFVRKIVMLTQAFLKQIFYSYLLGICGI